MSGRRSYVRFVLNPDSDGVFRLVRDVVVERVEGPEIVAISGEAAIIGETMTIDIPAHEAARALAVQVVESRPIVIDGALRHRLRLRKLSDVVAGTESAESAPQ